MAPISVLWASLSNVSILSFESCSRTGTGWDGRGAGTVSVEHPQDGVLVWRESGQWRQNGGRDIRFFNVFRWTRHNDMVSLAYLRFGENQPVFLFQLAAVEANLWRDVEPHLCRQDHYSAELALEGNGLKLSWTVKGPTRDESINYIYQP